MSTLAACSSSTIARPRSGRFFAQGLPVFPGHGGRFTLEASQHGIELPPRIGECPPARGIELAASEDAVQSPQPVAAVVQRPLEIGRNRQCHDCRPRVVAVASQVLQHDTGPVGAAKDIDAVVSEPLSHRVKVLNRIECRVLGQIGLPGQAIATRFDCWQVISRHHDVRRIVEVFTVERPGPARAALVDEHQVAMALERQPYPERRRRCRLYAGAALKEEYRIRLARRRRCTRCRM